MREVPEGAGTRPEGAAPTAHLRNNHLAREVVCVHSSAVHISFAGDREAAGSGRFSVQEWQYTISRYRHIGCPFGKLRSADLGAKAAETLRSPSGGVPAARGEAAATSERSERERQAVRFAVEAVCCGVVGCQRSDGLLRVETPDGPRVLCPAHLRRCRQ